MNATELQDFTEAVNLAHSGQKDKAYEKLLALSKATGAKDPQLLLWIAFTTPDLDEAETCIQMAEAKIPDDPSILNAYNWLRAERAKPKGNKIVSPPFIQQVPVQPIQKPPFQVAPAAQPLQPPQPITFYTPQPNTTSTTWPNPVPPQPSPPAQPWGFQAPPPVAITSAVPTAPAPAKPKVVKKKRNYKRLLFITGFVLVFLVAATIGIVFFAIPAIRGPEYTLYTKVATMVDQAAPKDLVKFYAKLTFNQLLTTDEYDYYAWYTNNDDDKPVTTTNVNIDPKTVRAVFVRFPRDGDLRPSTRYTYYYGMVLKQGYEGQSLLVDIQKVDYKDKSELVPVYPLIQGRALKTIRAQELPTMGKAPYKAGYLWISTDVEILIPKDDPNIKATSIGPDINSSKLYLESADAQYTGSYTPQRIDIGNIRTEGEFVVIPATIVILGPPDWKTLEWVVTVSQREIRVPLKL